MANERVGGDDVLNGERACDFAIERQQNCFRFPLYCQCFKLSILFYRGTSQATFSVSLPLDSTLQADSPYQFINIPSLCPLPFDKQALNSDLLPITG